MRNYKLIVTLIFVGGTVSQVCALGISPGRWTDVLPEHVTGDTVLGKAVTLFQDGPFSEVRLLDPAGIDVFFHNNLPTGTYLANENALVVDWAQVGTSTLNLPYNVSIPNGWIAPNGLGTHSMLEGLIHLQLADPSQGGIGALLGAVQQFSIYQNYAPRASLQNLATTELAVDLGLQFEDKSSSWWAYSTEHPWFSYGIDWDGDGSIDQTGTATFDEEPVPDSQHPTLSRWTSGIQTSTLQLDHLYDAAGNYTATLTLSDSTETTTLQIPVEIIPEPVTVALLGLGGFFLRKRKF